jgi:hypothetical protein
MKEYLENRIVELKSEYSALLTKIGNAKPATPEEPSNNENSQDWKRVDEIKGGLAELKVALKFQIDNNYVNQ